MSEKNPRQIHQLYPPPASSHALEGLYLGHNLRALDTDGRPFVYGNFIVSLDGRIAVPGDDGDLVVPDAIKNDRDWRLFQELAVQADILLTSGRYLREYEKGAVQEILQVYEDARFADLLQWRLERGLPPQPDLAVVSRSADFPIPGALLSADRRVIVVTTRSVPAERLKTFEGQAEIIVAGERGVDGAEMVRQLHALGYRLIYNATGPQVLHLLLAGDCLDRLYLTQAGRILGGAEFATFIEGERLIQPAEFSLTGMYYDPVALDGIGQIYSIFDRKR